MINILLGLLFIGCIALAAWAYRDGGSSKGIGRWVREVGDGLADIIALTVLFGWNWWSILIMGTVWGMTTYFKKKGTDAKWWNWALVGLVFAVIPLPQVIALSVHHVYLWTGFFIRAAFLVVFVPLWCTFVGNVQWSEGVRGGIQILTYLFMKIFK